MIIPCPYCGERPHSEFQYGGAAELKRPADPTSASDAEWLDYLYNRTNPCGAHQEYWHHTLGCDQWIKVSRHTLTHHIENAVGIDGGGA
jgi:heterotetrameric sarcosine oxidase delta subunit